MNDTSVKKVGQPQHYDELKSRLELSVTPTGARFAKLKAKQLGFSSLSKFIEVWARQNQ